MTEHRQCSMRDKNEVTILENINKCYNGLVRCMLFEKESKRTIFK